jgi:hypothetical protein
MKREPQFVDQVEMSGKKWALVLADGKLHFARLEERELEVIFLGELTGGRYKETVGDRIRVEFSHPRLKELEIEALTFETSRGIGQPDPVREVLRRWGETQGCRR